MVLCLCLSAVSATDSSNIKISDINEYVSSDVGVNGNINEYVSSDASVNDNINKNVNGEVTTVSDTNDPTFNDLQKKINSANKYILLENKTYKSSDKSLTVNKENFTFFGGNSYVNDGWDGKTSTLDAQSLSRIINCTGNNITFYGIIFINGATTQSNGGAFYYDSEYNNTFNFINCTFVNCSAISPNSYGGAIYSSGNSTITLNNCSFINCSTGGATGGAICVKGNLNIDRTSFIKCSSVSEGGAIYVNGNCTVEGSEFLDCTTNDSSSFTEGGAIYAQLGDCTIKDSTFDNCKAISRSSVSEGGAISVVGSLQNKIYNLNIINSVFTNCIAKSSGSNKACGGAISCKNVKWNIIDSTFMKCSVNSSNAYGGAIFLESIYKSTNHINYCIFEECTANVGKLIYFGNNSKNHTVLDFNFYGTANITADEFKNLYLMSDGNDYFAPDNMVVLKIIPNTDIFGVTDTYVIKFLNNNNGAEVSMKDYSVNVTFNNQTSAIVKVGDEEKIKGSRTVNIAVNSLYSKKLLDNLTVKNVPKPSDSFYYLNQTINSNPSSYVELSQDYICYDGVDIDFKHGIIINRSLTIDGKGHIIDGNNLARVFNVTADLTLINCTIINGWTEGIVKTLGIISNASGGSIYIENCTVTLINCDFINSSAVLSKPIFDSQIHHSGGGGAIFLNNGNLFVNNCNFIKCHYLMQYMSYSGGGAISIAGDSNVNVSNTNFISCDSNLGAGVIYNYGDNKNLTFTNSSFINCTYNDIGASVGSRPIVFYSLSNSIIPIIFNGCSFINCSYVGNDKYYYVIDSGNALINITKCIFDSPQGYYIKNSNNNSIFDSNFYGTTNITADEFKNLKLIVKSDNFYSTDAYAPDNMVILKINVKNDKYVINFVDNVTGEIVDMPVYEAILLESSSNNNVSRIISIESDCNYPIFASNFFDATVKSEISGINLTSISVSNKLIWLMLSDKTEFIAGAGENYTINMLGFDGNNCTVILELVNNGVCKNYTLVFEKVGYASGLKVNLPIYLNYPHNYTINVYFAAREGYGGTMLSQNISVIPSSTSKLVGPDVVTSSVYSSDKVIFNLTDQNGNVIANEYVTIHFKGLNGKVVDYKIKSNYKGNVILPLNLGYIGTYYATAEYKGNNYNSSKSNEVTINIINKANTKLVVDYENNTLITTPHSGQFVIKLLTYNNHPINNAKINIKFSNSNGIPNNYTIITDSRGFACLKLNLAYAGKYTIEAIFMGNDMYNQSNESITSVIVKKEDIIKLD